MIYTLSLIVIFFSFTLYAQIDIDKKFEVNNQQFNNPQLKNSSKINLPDSAALDSFITQVMNTYDIPGLASCVIKEGEIIYKGSFGYADIANNITVSNSTLFRLASVSKTIVGTALMQLWEKNLFDLDDDINTYLPAELQVHNPLFPNDSITFRMILSHVSSINDNWGILAPLYVNGDSPIALDSFLVNYLVPGGIFYSGNNYNSFAPATQTEYCNVAAALAAHLVESITG